MGRRGPPKKPTELKLLAGNPGKTKLEPDPPPLPPAPIECPEYLKGNARFEWERLVKELVDAGRLTVGDVTIFAAYCEAFATWRQYEGQCEEAGPQMAVAMGFRNAADRAADRMAKLGARFGLDAVSRGSIKVPPPKKPESDAAAQKARYFGGVIAGGKKA